MKILLSSATLFPLPIRQVMRIAKRAGFDGVEVFLFGKWTCERVERVLSRAEKLKLTTHFHQVWSAGESTDRSIELQNRVMTLLGLLPEDGYDFQRVVPKNARPLVAYSDRMGEADEGMWFQTLSVREG